MDQTPWSGREAPPLRRDDGLTFQPEDATEDTAPLGGASRAGNGSSARRGRLALPTPPPAPLTIGQQVHHPEHGVGRVSTISGAGPRAVATVMFDGQSSPRAFIIGHGSIVPIDGCRTDAPDTTP
jgi:hypothetical protein